MKITRVVLLMVIAVGGFAADNKYPVSELTAELKENANAIIREDQIVFTILARDRSEARFFHAITIMNERAKRYAILVLGYDKHSTIKGLRGTAYDANGKQIKRLKDSEIIDRSAFDGFSLYTDNRLKAADLTQSVYPYTVEFEWTEEKKYLYSINGTDIIPDEKISSQHTHYELIYPTNLRPRIKTMNLNKDEPLIQPLKNGTESMTWTFENTKAIIFEPLSPHQRDILPGIRVAPVEFEYDGYVGNMSTWQQYGLWNQRLNKGRDVLPETARQKVRELTKGATSKEQKAKIIYEYLQSRTRYVSIQLGIGGLQPFEAEVVEKTGYGDCKALSNYMVAMLKEVGVPAIYCTVMAGKDQPPTLVDFPTHQANHVIVAVPNGVDTVWLECTSQTNPFGYQGTFTGDRKALLITEEGGKLVNTTRYGISENAQARTADVLVDAAGDATSTIKTSYAGLKYETGGLNFVVDHPYDDQLKWVENNTGLSNFHINSFKITDHKAKIPSAVVDLDIAISRLATVSGKRLFLTPNLMNRSNFLPAKDEHRKTNFRLKGIKHVDLDTIRFRVGEDLYPEFLPEPIKFKSRFGEYEASFTLEQGKVIYIRRMVRENGEFPAQAYKELVDFYQKVNNADNIKLVFLNKT